MSECQSGKKNCIFLKNWPARKFFPFLICHLIIRKCIILLQTGGCGGGGVHGARPAQNTELVVSIYQLFNQLMTCGQWSCAFPLFAILSHAHVYRPPQWAVHRQVWTCRTDHLSELAVFLVAWYTYLPKYNSVLSGCVPRSTNCNPEQHGGENLCLSSSVWVLKGAQVWDFLSLRF